MKPLAMIAAAVVTLALISYSIAIITEQRKKIVSNFVIGFLTLGVILDIGSTSMMIIVSENSPFTLHGIMGYTALLLMLTDAVLLWNFRTKKGKETRVSTGLHRYSLVAYSLWIAAYLTGSLLVILR